MEKLKHGDYVEVLSEEQARELLDMDGHRYCESYVSRAAKNGMNYDSKWNELFAMFETGDPDKIALHDFETFKQKCINTFGK